MCRLLFSKSLINSIFFMIFKITPCFLILNLFVCQCSLNQNKQMKNKESHFEQLYINWIDATQQKRHYSKSTAYTELEEFQAIINEGDKIIPFLTQKLIKNQDIDFFLTDAVIAIKQWDIEEKYKTDIEMKRKIVLEKLKNKSYQPWPQESNPIVAIEYELIIGLDNEGQHIYQSGKVKDLKEIKTIQAILEPLRPQPATLTAKPMGKVHLRLANGEKITLLPIFHLPLDKYKDLFKVDNMDCLMPEAFADILNNWRGQLMEKK